MGLEIEERERSPGARLARGRRGCERARVHRPVDEAERDFERRRLATTRDERLAERLEHAPEQEGEGLETLDGPLELERRLEALGERCAHENSVVLATREPHEPRSLRAEALGEALRRQPRDVADRPQPPAPQDLLALGREGEPLERKRGERLGLGAGAARS